MTGTWSRQRQHSGSGSQFQWQRPAEWGVWQLTMTNDFVKSFTVTGIRLNPRRIGRYRSLVVVGRRSSVASSWWEQKKLDDSRWKCGATAKAWRTKLFSIINWYFCGSSDEVNSQQPASSQPSRSQLGDMGFEVWFLTREDPELADSCLPPVIGIEMRGWIILQTIVKHGLFTGMTLQFA